MIGLKRRDVGYFTSGDQKEPVHEPGLDGPCPLCGRKLDPEDVRTYSLMPLGENAPVVSCFYRTHSTCAKASDEATIQQLDAQALAIADTILS